MLFLLFLPLLSLAAYPFLINSDDTDNEAVTTNESDPEPILDNAASENEIDRDSILKFLKIYSGTVTGIDTPTVKDPDVEPTTTDIVEEPDTSPETVPDTDQDDVIYIDDVQTTGDEGDNTFKIEPGLDTFPFYSIDAGAGNDQVLLFNPEVDEFNEDSSVRTTVTGGAGDDLITAFVNSSWLNGGDGNDSINAFIGSGNSAVNGQDGDDYLWAENVSSGSVALHGGGGNDTVDLRNIDYGMGMGGNGDDVLYASGIAIHENEAYFLSAEGGAGDDTIHFVSDDKFLTAAYFSEILGGEGSDTFELTINEGEIFTPEYDDGYSPENNPNILSNENGVIRIEGVSLNDFDPQQDTLKIDVATANEEYRATTARLETGGDQKMFLVIRYESDTELTRDLLIGLGDVDLDINDINFVGDKTPQLIT